MAIRHTKEPWKREGSYESGFTVRAADGKCVCKMGEHFRPDIDRELADFIAAAPDLLKALKLLFDELKLIDYGKSGRAQIIDEYMQKAETAIAKAEGGESGD